MPGGPPCGSVSHSGPEGEPFARVGPAGVEVNRRSPLWVDNARAQERDPAATTAVVDPQAAPDWFTISAAPTFAWLEFRGAYPDPEPPRSAARAKEPTVLLEWSVPLAAGGQQAQVEGETLWAPGEPPAATDSEPARFLRAPVVATVLVVVAGAVARVWVGRRIGAVRRPTP